MELQPIPKDEEAAVMVSVNEVGNRLENNKALLKEWIKCQPHLPSNFDSRIFPLFLRGCKHDLEKTKRKLEMYYTCRSIYTDLFENRDPYSKPIQQALEAFNVVPLSKPTKDGYRVTLHRYTSSDANQFDPKSVFKTMFMIADIRLVEEPPIVGDIFIFDVKNITAAHFAKIATPVLKYTLHCVQEAYPQRLKEIHLFNAPPLIDRVVTFFKQFLKEKMRSRFHVHPGVETLYNFIPKTHLPREYNGDLPPLQQLQDRWNDKLKNYSKYFEEQENVKSDESKRVKDGSKSQIEMFGCEGAFRKLEID